MAPTLNPVELCGELWSFLAGNFESVHKVSCLQGKRQTTDTVPLNPMLARQSCREVQEDEDGEQIRVSCMEEIVGDINQSCFSAVFGAKTRLELIKEVIVIKVGLELRRDHSLKNVGNEGQIGNRSIVV